MKDKERKEHIDHIHSYLLLEMKILLETSIFNKLEPHDHQNETFHTYLLDLNELEIEKSAFRLNKTQIKGISDLWKDQNIQKTYNKRKETLSQCSLGHYMNLFDEICADEYNPSLDDLLSCTCSIDGMIEFQKTHRDKVDNFRLLDVSNEKKGWKKMFRGASAIMLLVSMSEFDKTDEMKENIELLKTLLDFLDSSDKETNNPTPIPILILFHNVVEFTEKVDAMDNGDLVKLFKNVSLVQKGGLTKSEACDVEFQNQFSVINKNVKRIVARKVIDIDDQQIIDKIWRMTYSVTSQGQTNEMDSQRRSPQK